MDINQKVGVLLCTFSTVWRGALVLFIVVAAGCLPSGPSDDGGSSNQYDEDCHYDCTGLYRCEDGDVYQKGGGAIPCEMAGTNGMSLRELCESRVSLVDRCEEGCRTDRPDPDEFTSTFAQCEEDRPKQVGETCTSDSDCEPPADDVAQLVCDETTASCVEPTSSGDAGNSDASDAGDTSDAADTSM